MRSVSFLKVASVAFLFLAAPACEDDDDVVEGALTDDEIAGVLRAANEGEIRTSQVALNKAQNEQVRDFATRMINEHQDAQQQLEAILDEEDLEIDDSDVSRDLQAMTEDTLATLENVSGPAFDRAYMDAQVAMHQNVLNLIDTRLLPSARNEALRSFLTAQRPVIQEHLNTASNIGEQLGGTASASTELPALP